MHDQRCYTTSLALFYSSNLTVHLSLFLQYLVPEVMVYLNARIPIIYVTIFHCLIFLFHKV